MPTLILSPRHTDSSQTLWRAAIAKGWDVERPPSFRIPSDFQPEDPVVYGEPLFNSMMAEHLGLTLAEPADDIMAKLPYGATKRLIRYVTAGEARKMPGPIFIKPPHQKTFTAGVYESGDGMPPEVEDHEMVLAQEVVRWGSEYRYFMLGNTNTTRSPYMYNGKYIPHHLEEAQSRILDDFLFNQVVPNLGPYNPPSAYVVDVGIIEGRGPAVVEFNEVCGSGIYNCDPDKVLLTLQGAISKTKGTNNAECR